MVHNPEFSDSLNRFLAKRLAEWELENPRPQSPQEQEPLDTLPKMVEGNNFKIAIVQKNQKAAFILDNGLIRISVNLEENHVQHLIENLLEVQCDMLSWAFWKQGGQHGLEWSARKSEFAQKLRREFIAQYEYRYSEKPQNASKNAQEGV